MLRKSKKVASDTTFLQRVGLYFYRKKETTILYWFAIVVFGVVSYTTLLPRQGFPSVDVPVSVVGAAYFVDNKTAVDEQLAVPLTNVVKKVEGVKDVSVSSSANFMTMVIEYSDGLTSASGSERVKNAVTAANVTPTEAVIKYQEIDASRFTERSDLLLSVYSKQEMTADVLAQKSKLVAEKLTESEAVASASYINQFESAINPSTGESTTLETGFDIVGNKDGIGQIHLNKSAVVGVRAEPSADAFELLDGVNEKVAELKNIPELSGIEYTVVADFAEGIESQVSGLQQSLLEGLVVVIVISFLLISWRAGLATALSMATTLLATIGILYATGNTLNTITLFALILSLGLIVDDTTIMVEAIDAEHDSKQKHEVIVKNAIKKVARASFAGTLTTMLGFAPMLFIGGILGDFIRILPITIIISLAASLVISLTLVPFFARLLLGGKRKKAGVIARAEKAVASKLSDLVVATKHSKKRMITTTVVALGIGAVCIGLSFVYFGKLKFDIFPATKDSDAIAITISTDPGASIEDAKSVVTMATTKASDAVGSNFKRLSLQGSGSSTGATVTIDLISFKKREKTSPQIIEDVTKAVSELEGATFKVAQLDAGPPKDTFPFKVKVYADDQTKSVATANTIKQFLENKEIERVNGTKSRINQVEVPTDDLKRDTRGAYTEVLANFTDDDVSALVTIAQNDVKQEFTSDKLVAAGLSADAVAFDFGSESDNQESFKSMLIAFPVLLIVMFALLAFQFKSLLQPLLIFAAIPYSFFGVAFGLYITNNPLSFFVMIGFFALIGIAVNNSILLTDYANQAQASGSHPVSAMASAIRARFRPLLTTSITSVVALVPLAISDPFWESLAYTLIFGLISSTVLVVICFPYMYLSGEFLRRKAKKMLKRSK